MGTPLPPIYRDIRRLLVHIHNFFNTIHRPTLYAMLCSRLEKSSLNPSHALALRSLCHKLRANKVTEQVRDAGAAARLPSHKRLANALPGCGLPVGQGIDFLGYRVFVDHRRVRPRVVQHCKAKLAVWAAQHVKQTFAAQVMALQAEWPGAHCQIQKGYQWVELPPLKPATPPTTARLRIGLFPIPPLQLFDRKPHPMKIKHLLACLLLSLSSCVLAAPFTVSADGQEVTDTKTGLIWRRCAEGMTASGGTCTGTASTFTNEAALTRASTQATATSVDWRLPNVKELSSIADKTRSNPAIDTTAFPATPVNWFWSSSPYVGVVDFARYVYFNDGSVYSGHRGNALPVRLVRSGQ